MTTIVTRLRNAAVIAEGLSDFLRNVATLEETSTNLRYDETDRELIARRLAEIEAMVPSPENVKEVSHV